VCHSFRAENNTHARTPSSNTAAAAAAIDDNGDGVSGSGNSRK